MFGTITIVFQMDCCRHPIGQALMRPFIAIEREVGFEARFKRRDVRVFEVNVPILNHPPYSDPRKSSQFFRPHGITE
jgi:hypothetical protein